MSSTRRFIRGSGLFAGVSISAQLILSGSAFAQTDDPIAYAQQVVKAGEQSKMSRSPLNEGGVHWSGADSSPTPIKDATVAIMPCQMELTACRFLFDSAEEAAKAIGWKVFPIDNKGDPALAQKGVDVAINKGVNCVLTLASPARDIKAQIERGEKKGIAFVTGFSDDPKAYGGDVGYGLDHGVAGDLLAAFVVAHGGGNVVTFDAPQLPQLSVRINGFADYVKKYAGDKAKVAQAEEFSMAAGIPGMITKMQAVLTRLPKGQVDWVIAPFDEGVAGLLEAAKERGRGEIRGVGFDGEAVAYDSIRNGGTQLATISWSLDWVAWAGIDECNRALNKAPVGVNKDFPLQLTDITNVPKAGSRYDTGFDFRGRYTQLWNAARQN
jgi:ABC-type sugar transport system substrate-binding protein